MRADIFDDQRRAWIAAHTGVFLIQKRRAELLGKKIRAHTRAQVGARPDPHDDQVTLPLAFRCTSTTTGALESALVSVCALAGPAGWPAGRAVYALLVGLIPDRLRAYPIPALLWAAVLCGAPLPLYEPSTNLWSMIIVPWLLAQLPATFLAAGIYGVIEGWLAVDGSTDWWPLTPIAGDVDDDLILGRAEVSMPTLLDDPQRPPISRRRPPPSIVSRRRTPPPIRWFPMLTAGLAAAIIAIWFLLNIFGALLSAPSRMQPGHDLDIAASSTPREPRPTTQSDVHICPGVLWNCPALVAVSYTRRYGSTL